MKKTTLFLVASLVMTLSALAVPGTGGKGKPAGVPSIKKPAATKAIKNGHGIAVEGAKLDTTAAKAVAKVVSAHK